MKQTTLTPIAITLLRISCGFLMMFNHGLPKLEKAPDIFYKFPDPLNIGSPTSAALVLFSEVFCAFLVTIGLSTRLACIPLVITMFTASFIHHLDDPFSQKELSLLYLILFIVLFITGSGKYNCNKWLPLNVKGIAKWLFEK